MKSTLYLLFFLFLIIILATGSMAKEPTTESTCYGTTQNGRLENGVKLPSKGPNFVSYTVLGGVLGRTYVHSRVRAIVLDAFRSLKKSHPDKIFMIGETGLKEGGRFKPHKTHQNGLSVDFMVPVADAEKKSVPLPTHPFNKYGYSIEFDKKGRFKDLKIDFEAMAAHLKSLHLAAKKSGNTIWRVIFDPKLQPLLFRTKAGRYLKTNLRFSKKRSWVRHDEHYHVDFKIKCKPL